jgi:hypothetical protein
MNVREHEVMECVECTGEYAIVHFEIVDSETIEFEAPDFAAEVDRRKCGGDVVMLDEYY